MHIKQSSSLFHCRPYAMFHFNEYDAPSKTKVWIEACSKRIYSTYIHTFLGTQVDKNDGRKVTCTSTLMSRGYNCITTQKKTQKDSGLEKGTSGR